VSVQRAPCHPERSRGTATILRPLALIVARLVLSVVALCIAPPVAARPYGQPTIAPTPQIAATNSVGGAVVRTNVVGSYAAVLVHGGQMEDTSEDMIVLTGPRPISQRFVRSNSPRS
jgi:hypothetical protein